MADMTERASELIKAILARQKGLTNKKKENKQPFLSRLAQHRVKLLIRVLQVPRPLPILLNYFLVLQFDQ